MTTAAGAGGQRVGCGRRKDTDSVQVGCEDREGQVSETGELVSPRTPAPRAELLAPFPLNPALGTSESPGVGDCGSRKSEVCQQMVLQRRPGLRTGSPPGLTHLCFPSGLGPTPAPGIAVLRAC